MAEVLQAGGPPSTSRTATIMRCRVSGSQPSCYPAHVGAVASSCPVCLPRRRWLRLRGFAAVSANDVERIFIKDAVRGQAGLSQHGFCAATRNRRASVRLRSDAGLVLRGLKLAQRGFDCSSGSAVI